MRPIGAPPQTRSPGRPARSFAAPAIPPGRRILNPQSETLMNQEVANPPGATERRKHRLQIVYRQIDQLKPDPRNPRHHSRKQIKQLARSIETFGLTVPPLVDREDNVIAGHGRVLACRELGWSEIPT